MLIAGTKHWNENGRLHSQENNPTEVYLKTTIKDRIGWLESCGPTSAVNCLSSMGHDIEVVTPGSYKPQPEEVLMDYFNDPSNRRALQDIRVVDDTIPGNRVPQYYPKAVYDVFGVHVDFRWGPTFDTISDIVSKGRAVQLCLENPGHYIAVVAYDAEKKELIYHDSWGARFKDGKGGFARRMGEAEFKMNVKTFYLVYGLV